MTFTEYLRYINLKDKSIKRYIKVIDSFFSILNKENVEEVRVEDIRSYIENLKEINKARTINQKLAILRQYIIYSSIKTQDNYGEYVVNLKNRRNIFTGERNNHLLLLYSSIRDIPYKEELFLDNLFTNGDIEAIKKMTRQKKDKRAEALFELLHKTGMRISEALRCGVEELDKEYFLVLGKRDRERKVPIPQSVRKKIKEYINKKRVEEKYIFTGRQGRITTRTALNITKKYCHLAGIDSKKAFNHNFRHNFILNMLKKGYSESQINRITGHSMRTIREYTRKNIKDVSKDMDEM